MSRFESSRFVRNPQVMQCGRIKVRMRCFGVAIHHQDNILTVSDAKQKSRLYGEFALKFEPYNK